MQALPYTYPHRTCYACAALPIADSNAPLCIAVIAHALSRLSYCLHANGTGCLIAIADDEAMRARSSSARAGCASGYWPGHMTCMGGGLPLDPPATSTGMHRLSRFARKVPTLEIRSLLCPGGGFS